MRDLYQSKAEMREAAIHDLMWNDTMGSWFDLNLGPFTQNPNFYPINLSPMFTGCYGNINGTSKLYFEEKTVDYLKVSVRINFNFSVVIFESLFFGIVLAELQAKQKIGFDII